MHGFVHPENATSHPSSVKDMVRLSGKPHIVMHAGAGYVAC